MRARIHAVALVGALASISAGRLATADEHDESAADALFRRGRANADAGDYPHACAEFAESFRLDPAAGTLLNLADCEEHVGRVASAWGHFLRVVSALPATDERVPIARARAAALEPRLPWIAVHLAADAPSDARVFNDDVEIEGARAAAPIAVDPGPHTVLVVAVGRQAKTVSVLAVERATVQVEADAGPAVAHEEARRSSPPVAAWIVGGLGVASLGVGTYFGGRAVSERSVSDAGCMGSVCSNPTSVQAYASARTDARAADVALGIGVVGVAVSAILLITSRGEPPRASALRFTGSGVAGRW